MKGVVWRCGGPLVGRSRGGPSASLDIPTRGVPEPRWRFGSDSLVLLTLSSGLPWPGVSPKHVNDDRENDLACVGD